MSKEIANIPLSRIERIQIYINQDRKTLAQIKAETGADYLMNGGLYDMGKWTANCQLKAEGDIYAKDPYTYWGYGWNTGPDIAMNLIPSSDYLNYISCVELLRHGIPNGSPIYAPAQGGKRGRTAMGLQGDKFCLYVSSDGSNDAKTPERLRDELHDLGWSSAVMLDGGGSSQCDFAGRRITSSRKVHNLILVYLKKEGEKPMSKKRIVCLDPGHSPAEKANKSPDGTYYEYEFAWDMGQRIKALLKSLGSFQIVLTKTANEAKSLTARATVSNNAEADLFLSLHTNAAAGSGWSNARGLEVYTSVSGSTAKRNIVANKIIARMKEAGVIMRSSPLKHSLFTVLAKTNAPACLIEYGFHTNQEDVALLKTAYYRDKMAVATAKGICDFFGVDYTEGQAAEEEETVKRYNKIDEVPSWGKEAVQAVMDKGYLQGDQHGNLDLSHDMLRMLIINYRAGLYK